MSHANDSNSTTTSTAKAEEMITHLNMELEHLKTSFYKKLLALKNELKIGNYYVCEDRDVFEAIGEKYSFKYNINLQTRS